LSRATELDSRFAEAWAELAECRAEMFFEEIDLSVETREAAAAGNEQGADAGT